MNAAKRTGKILDLHRAYVLAGKDVPNFRDWPSKLIRHEHRRLGLSQRSHRNREEAVKL